MHCTVEKGFCNSELKGRKVMEKLRACGIDIAKGQENYGEEYIAELKKFINGYDFMRLGQAVNGGRWESAMMACRRMSMTAEKLGLDCFSRQFTGLRQNIARKSEAEVKNILSIMIRRRIMIRDVLKEFE